MVICTICFHGGAGPWVALEDCGHSFHRHCIRRWLLRHDTCPMCRTTCTGEAELYRTGDDTWTPGHGDDAVVKRPQWRRVAGRVRRGRA